MKKAKSKSKKIKSSPKSHRHHIPYSIYAALIVVIVLLGTSFYGLVQQNSQARARIEQISP